MAEFTIRDHYLEEASIYRNYYSHLNIQMTQDQAKKELSELGIFEESYKGKLISDYVPHLQKSLACIALGKNSQKILQDQFPREERIKILIETASVEDSMNLATVMCLMRHLF